ALRLLAMLHEDLFDMGINKLSREVANLLEGNIDSFHAEHVKTRIDEIFGKGLVDSAREVGGADKALDLERAQRADMVRPGCKDRPPVFLFPLLDQVRFAFIAQHHEGRRTLRMDQVHFVFRELLDQRFVMANDAREFLSHAALNIEKEGNDAHALRKDAT